MISFFMLLEELKHQEDNKVEKLSQHPFMTRDMTALEFKEIVNCMHMTDSDIVIGSRNGNVHVVDIKTLKRRQIDVKCHDSVLCIASCGNFFAVSGMEGNLSLWKLDK